GCRRAPRCSGRSRCQRPAGARTPPAGRNGCCCGYPGATGPRWRRPCTPPAGYAAPARLATRCGSRLIRSTCCDRRLGTDCQRPTADRGRILTVQPIRLFGDPVLRTPAEPVVDFDKELRTLVTDLTDTLREQ